MFTVAGTLELMLLLDLPLHPNRERITATTGTRVTVKEIAFLHMSRTPGSLWKKAQKGAVSAGPQCSRAFFLPFLQGGDPSY